MRNDSGAQRGSVADMPLYPGDPLTPGVAAKGDVKRLAVKDAPTITKIPVLPISYGDAKPLLSELKGRVAPEEFRGACRSRTTSAPAPRRSISKSSRIGTSNPSATSSPRSPARNRRTSGSFAATTTTPGSTALKTRSPARLRCLKKPAPSPNLSSRDGSPSARSFSAPGTVKSRGLLGSTEWCEAHADELSAHAALYVNSDTNGRGFLGVEGSHSLEKFVNGVSRDIIDPEKNISVANRLKARLLTSGNADVVKEVRTRPDLRIAAMGSGSDYGAFIDHLGIASIDLGFGGEDSGGVYHSAYDDFYWFTHFADTDFVYGRALSQTAGTMLMRFADADVLPYDFVNFADTMHRYAAEVKKLLSDKQIEIRERNEAIDQHLYDLVSDPRHPMLPPAKQAIPPFLNFAPLENALSTLDRTQCGIQKRSRPSRRRATFRTARIWPR